MRRLTFIIIILFIMLGMSNTSVFADELVFDSFEEAKQAADRRGEEYDKKMMEYVTINKDWDSDDGSQVNGSNPREIIDHRYDEGSVGTDAGQELRSDTDKRINDLKDRLINTGSGLVAGATAAYQWSVKVVNGKYVLSDSYSAASFNTGATDGPVATKPAPDSPTNPGSDKLGSDKLGSNDTVAPPKETVVNIVSPGGSSTPKPTPSANGDEEEPIVPHNYVEDVDTTMEPEKEQLANANPTPSEGFAVGVPTHQAPAVRLIIQHPIEQLEEAFSCNADPEEQIELSLDEFTIPEDTRVRMSIEIGDEVNPDDIFMVITDDEGDTDFIPASHFANYRHMFRIPSLDEYFVKIFVKDHSNYGELVQVMRVAVPVTKVDFDSRSIGNNRAY
jgi:hypothetical protein